MPISDVINVSISVSGAGPSQANFGVPCIAAASLWFTNAVRSYSSANAVLTEATAALGAGPAAIHPAYICASQIFAQNPAPPLVLIGPRTSNYTQTTTMLLLSVSNLDTYTIQLRQPGGALKTVSFQSTGVPTADVLTMNTAVTALAIPGLVATHSSATMTLTMTAGLLLDVYPDVPAHMTFTDTTPSPAGLTTDLNNLVTYASSQGGFYFLLLDSNSAAEITTAAAFAEANGPMMFVWNNSDTICATGSSSDIFSTEKGLSHARSGGIFAQTELLSYSGAAWVGRMAPTTAGSENWAMKTLANVPIDNLTTTQIHNVEGKNGSVYSSLLGVGVTQFGKQPSGQWLDITRGSDALTNAIQVGIVTLQLNNLKVPYTDAGVDLVRGVLTGVLQSFVQSGFIAASPAFTISTPAIASVAYANKALRNLPSVFFAATLAGAINSVQITGVLTY